MAISIPKLRISKLALFAVLALPLVGIGTSVWYEVTGQGSAPSAAPSDGRAADDGFPGRRVRERERLGADPGKELTKELGEWALRMLLLTLAVSSIARLARRPRLIQFRRMVGLWAFAYAALHFGMYFAAMAGLSITGVVDDFAERPYITVGIAGLVLLIPLTVTSTRGWQRRLAGRWRKLHRLVYLIAVLAIIHFLWLSRGDYTEVAIHALVLAALFAERIVDMLRRRRQRARAA